jgi:hypothetical protein
MTLEAEFSCAVRKWCYTYIDAVLDGLNGEWLRSIIHGYFRDYLSSKCSGEDLDSVLHYLDRHIGLDLDLVGAEVDDAIIEGYSKELYNKVFPMLEPPTQTKGSARKC